jgi:predicted phage terminase large subunit-like protein
LIDRRTRDLFRSILPELGIGDYKDFAKLPEAEQLRQATAAITKLEDSKRLALAGIIEPSARTLARTEIAAYIHYLGLDFRPALHQKVLLDGLERVERREIDRLMLFMPPGSAKSTYASVIFPAWYLGKNPTHSLIAVTHTEELTVRFGRRARNHYATQAHKQVFGMGLSRDSGAAGRWDTAAGGEYYAVGFNGSVTGRRADILLIDDPVKGREEADSQRIRDKTWDIYINDLLTRLKPEGRRILVTTRWHEDDLAGRILEMEGDRWDRIRLPMEAQANDILGRKPGERLWPEWFTEEMVADAKRDSRAWNALYQQEPAGEDGDFFKREWFRDYDIAPGSASLRIYAASDYAVTEKGGDFTEHAVFGMDFNRNLYVLDWWSGQETAARWIEVQCDLIQKWKPVKWFGEAGPIRRAIEPFLLRRMDERAAYCPLEWLPSIHDKPTRLRAFQGMCAQGKVWFPKPNGANRGTDWRSDVIGQLLRFPVGMHDDKVDACSLLGRGLEYVNAPEAADNIVNLQTHYNRGYESAKQRYGSMRNRHEHNRGIGRHA